jgi:hypothetical protein
LTQFLPVEKKIVFLFCAWINSSRLGFPVSARLYQIACR